MCFYLGGGSKGFKVNSSILRHYKVTRHCNKSQSPWESDWFSIRTKDKTTRLDRYRRPEYWNLRDVICKHGGSLWSAKCSRRFTYFSLRRCNGKSEIFFTNFLYENHSRGIFPYWIPGSNSSHHSSTSQNSQNSLKSGTCEPDFTSMIEDLQVYTTQEGIEDIKNNSQVCTTQEGKEDYI